MGVRRISVGGSLARVAMHAFIRTATEIAKDGKFDGFAGLVSNPELNKFFSEDRKKLRHDRLLRLVGPPVDPTPAPPPGPVTLSGRFGSVSRLDAGRDAADLWQALARP